MIERDILNTPAIAVIGVVGTVTTFVVVLCLQVMVHRATDAQMVRREAAKSTSEYEVLLAEQRASLERYEWIDEEAGTVAIPVERAMELVVRDAAANAPSASY